MGIYLAQIFGKLQWCYLLLKFVTHWNFLI